MRSAVWKKTHIEIVQKMDAREGAQRGPENEGKGIRHKLLKIIIVI